MFVHDSFQTDAAQIHSTQVLAAVLLASPPSEAWSSSSLIDFQACHCWQQFAVNLTCFFGNLDSEHLFVAIIQFSIMHWHFTDDDYRSASLVVQVVLRSFKMFEPMMRLINSDPVFRQIQNMRGAF